jgi:hypothetical protein
MPFAISRSHPFLFLLIFLISSQLHAKSPNNSDAIGLKRYDLKSAETLIQNALIKQITITNIIKNETRYKVSVEPGRTGGTAVDALSFEAKSTPRRSVARASPRKAAPVARGASSTNVREKGVDEADLVKTDGRYLFSLGSLGKKQGLRIYDTRHQNKKLKQIATLGFEKGVNFKGLYLLAAQQKLVVIAQTYRNAIKHKIRRHNWGGNTRLIFIDIRNKNKPRITRQVNLEGSSRSNYRIGNQLYMVLNTYSFRLPPTYKTITSNKPISQQQYEHEKQRLINIIKAWRIDQQLPRYSEQGKQGSHSLIKNKQFYLNINDIRSYSLSVAVAIDLNSAQFKADGIAYFGSPDTVYVTPRSMYISSRFHNDFKSSLDKNSYPRNISKTLIHKFALNSGHYNYRGSGVVLGSLGWNEMSTFQLDEDKKGNLRVVTSNWNANNKKNTSNDPATRSPVILTALGEHNGSLTTLSRLPNRYYPQPLGKPGESLYGARLFDDYAYFVTFRRTDPLYVIDMRNPRSMKVAGKLVIPGFSDYLHPIENGLLLGIGKEVEVLKNGRTGRSKGLKLSLFDIRNPSRPREISKIIIGNQTSDTQVSRNHHALTTLKVGNSGITRLLIPATIYDKKTTRSIAGLHRFEIDSRHKKISHLGKIPALTKNNGQWYWNYNDRSIMIGERVFYFHQGKFQEAPWKVPAASSVKKSTNNPQW